MAGAQASKQHAQLKVEAPVVDHRRDVLAELRGHRRQRARRRCAGRHPAAQPHALPYRHQQRRRHLLDQLQPGALHAEGGAKVVWIDFKAGKSRPLPDRLRALLPVA